MKPRIFRVYVIEERVHGGLVYYVGSTAHTPEMRLRQHVRGKRFCPMCRPKHTLRGNHARLALFRGVSGASFQTREAAEKVERRVARELRARGFEVDGGH